MSMIKEKLVKARHNKKFSQEDMSQYLNISQTQYSRKENGMVSVSHEEWERIAKLLDVSVEEIKEDNEKNIAQHFENVTGSYTGSYIRSNNNYCNVPEFLLTTQQKYVDFLEEKITKLENRIQELEGNKTH